MFTFDMLILESKSQRHAYESEMNTLSAEPGAGKSQAFRMSIIDPYCVAYEESKESSDNQGNVGVKRKVLTTVALASKEGCDKEHKVKECGNASDNNVKRQR